MKKAFILITTLLAIVSCNSNQPKILLFVKSLDDSNVRGLNIKFNDSTVVKTDIAPNVVDHSYNFFRIATNSGSDSSKITVTIDDTLKKDMILNPNKSYKVIVMIRSGKPVRNYNNPQIYEHMKDVAVGDYKKFVDSLYEKNILKDYIRLPKDSLLDVIIQENKEGVK